MCIEVNRMYLVIYTRLISNSFPLQLMIKDKLIKYKETSIQMDFFKMYSTNSFSSEI